MYFRGKTLEPILPVPEFFPRKVATVQIPFPETCRLLLIFVPLKLAASITRELVVRITENHQSRRQKRDVTNPPQAHPKNL